MSDKFRIQKLRNIFFVMFFLFLGIIAVDVTLFYYKYTNVKNEHVVNYKSEANFLLDSFLENLNIRDGEIDLKKSYEYGKTPYYSYILKLDSSGVYRISSTPDSNFLIGDEFADSACGLGFSRHNFSNTFINKTIHPENRVEICIFKKIGTETLYGMKYTFAQMITDSNDPDFKEWFVKNLSPTIILSSISGFFIFVVFIWFSARYMNLKTEFSKFRIESKRLLKDIQQKRYVDPLTGLFNKTALINDIKDLDKPKIVILDIDNFGGMNDYYGKDVCDKILIHMSNLLKDFARSENMKLYTIAADQFVLLENGDFFIDRYEDLANELLNRFKGRLININTNSESLDIEVHTTIGFALDKDQTLMKAANALKVAKKLNKDYVCYYRGLNKKDEYTKKIDRSNLIRRAIINNNILPFYQPIHNANSDIVKYECLIRIVDNGDVVSPHIFLNISKHIKRYAELQKMIITKAIEKLNENEELVLSVNLSARDMTDGDVSMLIFKLLNQFNVAERLVFEIVEDESIDNVERIENFIEKVKNMGVKIAIDDFGSGYSNFSYVLKLRPDYIKIDGSLIKNIDINSDSYMITRAIVTFAKDLGIKTIAEYIHSKEVFEVCKKLGIDEYQGFYLGVPTDDIV